MKKTLLLLLLTCSCAIAAAQERSPLRQTEFISADSLEDEHELLERVRNMPNLEVGKGITFRPKSNWFSLTMRFRMQNMVGLSFDKDFTLTKTDAQVKRLRLRFDGYIYSPKLVYSVQLGFTSYDTEPLPNGNMNIVRDAIVYYVPSPKWNIGFGQTKIKANRARINSSSALQFVDRSIVNSEFNLDRDFGFFGEYNMRGGEGFNLSAKGSVTLGEGRNWGSSSNGGLAYTGRLELYPLGRFKSKGDVMEGDFEGEEQVKILVAGAYSYNHKASRLKGQRGAIMPDDATRNIGSYFADFILKYRGFAFYTDFMGRSCDRPLFDPQSNAFVYSGQGLNIQTSYLFDKKWEVALRNSTLFPEHEVQPFAGYKRWNQTTVGITRYIIGHSLKVQADMSYNHRSESLGNPLPAGAGALTRQQENTKTPGYCREFLFRGRSPVTGFSARSAHTPRHRPGHGGGWQGRNRTPPTRYGAGGWAGGCRTSCARRGTYNRTGSRGKASRTTRTRRAGTPRRRASCAPRVAAPRCGVQSRSIRPRSRAPGPYPRS